MAPTYEDLLREARASVPEIAPAELARLRGRRGIVVVDVREPAEWSEGRIDGALLVPRSRLEAGIEAAVPDRSTPLVLYCAVGARSLLAGADLRRMGYRDVVSLAGGIEAWWASGLGEPRPAGLRDDQRTRYARHLRIPEVGTAGQARLLAARVLVLGAGGLGSPAALYLAAAGVGTIGIADFDVVEPSNLQRQVLHASDRVGERKTASAARTIAALNPDVTVVGIDERIDAANADRILGGGWEVVLDGTDSFEARYALNDAAVRAGIPVVHASVFRFEGQVTAFVPGIGPCYRCLHPVPPPPEFAPACSVAGVLGVVPGLLGLLQATEVLKLLLGIGRTLAGRLLLVDALDGEVTEIRIPRDPACTACGGAPAPVRGAATGLPDADAASATGSPVRLLAPAPAGRTAAGARPAPAAPSASVAVLPAPLARELLDHARAARPREACGLVVGTAAHDAGGRPLRYLPCRNVAADPARYEADPGEVARIVSAAEAAGEGLWAIVHSHAAGPAVPSATDLAAARWPGVLHLLVDPTRDPAAAGGDPGAGRPGAGGEPSADPAAVGALRAWRIEAGRSSEVALVLEGAAGGRAPG